MSVRSVKAVSFVLMIALFSTMFAPMVQAEGPSGASMPEALKGPDGTGDDLGTSLGSPFLIDSDTSMDSYAALYGWTGSGTVESPYVANNLNINLPYYSTYGYCLLFKDTTRHIIIANGSFSNAKYVSSPLNTGAAIIIYNADNIDVRDSNIYGCSRGIDIVSSASVSVVRTSISTSSTTPYSGILVSGCDDILLDAVNVNVNYYSTYSLRVESSTGVTVQFSTFQTRLVSFSASNGNLFRNNTVSYMNYGSMELTDADGNLLLYNYFVGSSGSALTISGSTGNQVRNNTFGSANTGIYVTGSSTAQIISGNLFDWTYTAVRTVGSSNDVISYNRFNGNSYGIHLTTSTGIVLLRNGLEGCSYYGIMVESCTAIRAYENELNRTSFAVFGDEASVISHTIPVNNTVNGNPVYYYANIDATGMSVPTDAGQVLLAGVDNMRVAGLNLSAQNLGIQAVHCGGLVIEDNLLQGMYPYGIMLYETSACLVQNNTLTDFETGLWSIYATSGTVLDNTFSGDAYKAIDYLGSTNIFVQGNIVGPCARAGISFSNSFDNQFYSNLLTGSSFDLDGGMETFGQEIMPTNNTVNGRPLYYYIAGGVNVPSDAGQVILGSGSGFVLDGLNLSQQNVGLLIGQASDVLVQNCEFDQNSPYNVRTFQSEGVTFRDIDMANGSDGVYIEASNDVLFDNCTFADLDTALDLESAYDLEVWNCTFIRCDDCIDGYIVNSVRISHNAFSGSGDDGYAISMYDCDLWTVDNNTFADIIRGLFAEYSTGMEVEFNELSSMDQGIIAEGLCGGVIANNTLTDMWQRGISVRYQSNVLVRGNQITMADIAIQVHDTDNAVVEDNFVQLSSYGIYVEYSHYVQMSGNVMYACGYGVFLYQSNEAEVSSFFVECETGVSAGYYSQGAEVALSVFDGCVRGVELGMYAHYSSVHDNTFVNGTEYGVIVSSAMDVSIVGNDISGSGYGVHVECWMSYMSIECSVTDNTFSVDGVGVHISGHVLVAINENVFDHCSAGGVLIDDQAYGMLMGNALTGCSVHIQGDQATWEKQQILSNNTVNGLPVYYYSRTSINMNGQTAPEGAGQLIFAGQTGFRVVGLTLSHQTAALLIGYSSSFQVDHNTFNDSHLYGMLACSSSYATVNNNLFMDDAMGMGMMDCAEGYVHHNTFMYCGTGMDLNAYITPFEFNDFIGCVDGVRSTGGDNSFMANEFVDCTGAGFYVHYGHDLVMDNNFTGCANGASLDDSSSEFYNNDFLDCSNGVYALRSYATINNNIFTTCGKGVMAEVDDGSSINGNVFTDCANYAVITTGAWEQGEFQRGHYTNIDDNLIVNGTVGIGADGVDVVYLDGNDVGGCGVGIWINDSSDGVLYGNAISACVNGLVLENSSTMDITANEVAGSSNYGIWLKASYMNSLTMNLISDSASYGMVTNLSYYNTIQRNRFVHNNGATDVYDPDHVQAYDDGYVYVEYDAPLIEIDYPFDGYITTSGEFDLQWWVHDEGSGTASCMISIDGGEPFAPEEWNDWGDDWWYGWSYIYLDEGTHTVDIIAADYSGNVGMETLDILVDHDYDGPMFDSWWPSSGDEVSEWDYFEWYLVQGNYDITDMSCTANGEDLYIDYWGYDGGGWWYGYLYFESNDMGPGGYVLVLTVTDANGNVITLAVDIIIYGDNFSPVELGSLVVENTGSNYWAGDVGNYWSDWLLPDEGRDSIVDQVYELDGSVANDSAPAAHLVAIPYISYYDYGEDYVYLEWSWNYSLLEDLNGFDVKRVGEGSEPVSFVSGPYHVDYDVAYYGNYTYFVRVNYAGYVGPWSEGLNIQLPDNYQPEVYILNPGWGDTVNDTFVEWEGYDYESGIDHYEVRLNEGDYVDVGTDTNYTFADAVSGLNTVYVCAYDIAGNYYEEYVEFYLDVDAPVIEIYCPEDGEVIAAVNEGWVWFEWDVYDVDSDIDRYEYTLDGENWTDATGWYDADVWLADGNYTFTLRAYDTAGNMKEASVEFVVDTVAPEVDITDPLADDITDDEVNATWTAADDRCGMDSFDVYLDGDFVDWTYGQYFMLSGLGSGEHLLEVYGYDHAGNDGYDSVTFFVDGEAPVVLIYTPIDGSYYDQQCQGEVWFQWSAQDLDTGVALVEWSFDGVNWTDADGGTEMTITMIDGEYEFLVRAHDGAGNNATASAAFTVDSVGPELEIITPEMDTVFGIDVVNVTWTASDAISGIGSYDVYMDGEFVAQTDDQFMNLSGLSEGEHVVEVYPYDMAGNEGYDHVVFVVDLTAPELVLLTPQEHDIFGEASSSPLVVSWTCSDAVSGIDRYEMMVDGSDAVGYGPGALSAELDLIEGGHELTLTAFDMAGNSVSVTASFVIDRTAPEVSVLSPADGAILADGNVVLEWEGLDVATDIDRFEVSVDDDVVTVPAAEFSLVLDLADGAHEIVVTAFDMAGNPASDAITVTVDTAAPVITISDPDEDLWSGTGDVTVWWNATDIVSGVSYCQAQVNGGPWTTATDKLVMTDLDDGAYNIVVRAYDGAGNLASAERSFSVDTTSPTVAVADMGALFNDDQVAISWTGADAGSGLVGFRYSVDGGAWSYMTASLSIDLTGLAEGDHTFTVKAVDAVGNEASDSVTFSVDTVAPTVAIEDMAGRYSTDAVTISWTGSDASSGLSGYRYRLNEGNWSDLTDELSIGLIDLEDGAHIFDLKAVDAAGNEAVDSIVFTVDTVAPTMNDYGPKGEEVPVDAVIFVTFSEEMDEGSIVFDVEGLSGTVSWDGNTATFTPEDGMDFLTLYNVTVSCEDLTGNEMLRTWNYTTADYDGVLEGTLQDADGNPIVGATIMLSDGTSTTTDADGHFEFDGLAPGNYTLTVSMDGYEDATFDASLGTNQMLDMGSLALMDVDEGFLWQPYAILIGGILAVGLILFLMSGKKRKKQ